MNLSNNEKFQCIMIVGMMLVAICVVGWIAIDNNIQLEGIHKVWVTTPMLFCFTFSLLLLPLVYLKNRSKTMNNEKK